LRRKAGRCLGASPGADFRGRLYDDLVVPKNVTLLYLPPYSAELNPKENLCNEIREKIFKNYALKSIDAVEAKLKHAIAYIERNPKLVQSITLL